MTQIDGSAGGEVVVPLLGLVQLRSFRAKVEIAQDEAKDTEHLGWAPRTLENIGDMKPLPERGQTEPRPTGPRA